MLFRSVTARDIYIMLGAYVYYRRAGPFQMEPSLISKFNTFMQILTVSALLVSLSYFELPSQLIDYLIWTVYVTVIASTIHYSWVWGIKYSSVKSADERLG